MIGSINEVIYNFGYKIMCLKRERKGDKGKQNSFNTRLIVWSLEHLNSFCPCWGGREEEENTP